MATPLEFWFELASTYSYPAAMRVEGLARAAGVPLRWRAFLLGPIFAAQGWQDSPFNLYPVKGRYMWHDLARQCAAAGVPLRRPSVFPRGSLPAARIACLAADEPWVGAFVRAVYRANFAADQSIGDPAVVAAALRQAGVAPEPWLAQATSEAAKQALRAQTEAATALGIFGAPTFVVGGELFWGNDRLEAALAAAGGTADAVDVEAVLDFWFGPPAADAAAAAAACRRWFVADPALDAEIAARFGAAHDTAVRRRLDHWAATARGRLALIVLLDQFGRNLHRGRGAAFASDAHALGLALTGLDAGLDRQLGPLERGVFYLPLEHAEDAAVQAQSVACFERLHAESPDWARASTAELAHHARQHRDVIARFGRFPTRNAALGRPSTPAERAYLAAAGGA